MISCDNIKNALDPICCSKRIFKKRTNNVASEGVVELYLRNDVNGGYVVCMYYDKPSSSGVAHAFATYEEAKACYLDAMLTLLARCDWSEKEIVDKTKCTILHPPYHPELDI